MNIILFDDQRVSHLYPFTLTRPAALIRCGIQTLAEKWDFSGETVVSFLTPEYLSARYPQRREEDNFFINGRYLADRELKETVVSLGYGQSVMHNDQVVAYRGAALEDHVHAEKISFSGQFSCLEHIHDIFTLNHAQLLADFSRLTAGRKSATLSATNTVTGPNPVFLEEGAKAEASVFNTHDGPVYIGKGAEVMEGCLVRGPFALCEGAALKMGAKIYGATTVGPFSKVGGEVNNSVIFSYSNKGHDGFLGNSVLGEWCNMGADSNNSNLKNNYEVVKLWNYASERFEKTGLQFCGLFMGDHSKCGINTMFNTGTVVGVSANIFGSGFPRNFIPSFSWGGAQGFETYTTAKAFETARLVMERRNMQLTDQDKQVLTHIFNTEAKYRNKE